MQMDHPDQNVHPLFLRAARQRLLRVQLEAVSAKQGQLGEELCLKGPFAVDSHCTMSLLVQSVTYWVMWYAERGILLLILLLQRPF